MFEFFATGFNIILYRPLFNLLVAIYNWLPNHDFGLAIIIVTLVIRFILYPLSAKAFASQRALQKIQPKLQEIQKKYKDNKEKQTQELLALYRAEKINPFSSLFLVIVQLPILIALYQVFFEGLKPEKLVYLYSFVANPGHVDPGFLGIVNLANTHNLWLALLAAILQFFQTKMLIPQTTTQGKAGDIASLMQKQMVYIFPIVTVVILYTIPAALSLYWIISGVFSIVQQYFMLKKHSSHDQS